MKKLFLFLFSVSLSAFSFSQCQAYFTSSINGDTGTFTDASTGSNVGYYWSFGDGTTSMNQNPTHTYTYTGYYAVCLTIYALDSMTNCQDTYCDSIFVLADSNASNCNLSVNASGSQNGLITGSATGASSYSWSLYDPNSVYVQSFYGSSFTYYTSTPGNYYVCAVGYDNMQSQCDSSCYLVFVSDTTSGGGCNLSVNVSGSQNGYIGGTATGADSYSWSLYGNTGYIQSFSGSSFTYYTSTPGNYFVCAVGYDSMQMQCDSSCYSVTVTDTTSGNGCNLSATVSGNQYGVIAGYATGASSYTWSLYDPNSNFIQSISGNSLTYYTSVPGTYYVCVTGYDNAQMQCDSNCYSVYVTDTLSGGGCNMSVNVSGNQNGVITGSATGASWYTWSIYDTNSGYLQGFSGSSFTYNSPNPGTYYVCITAFDSLQQECDSNCYLVATDSTAGLNTLDDIVFQVYPNPATDNLVIEGSPDQIDRIVIINVSGATVFEHLWSTSKMTVDLTRFTQGMYFIHALGTDGQRISSQKIIKQ